MAQSLLAIAAYMALLGGIIFGVSRYGKSEKKENAIELLSQLTFEPIESSADEKTAELSVEPVSEPVVTEAAEEVTADFEVAHAIAITEPRDEVAEILIPPAIQDPKRSEAIEPREAVLDFTIPPTIQDPKRPNDSKVEDLTQAILALGQSKDLKHVAKLIQYATHSDPIVRSHVAAALGQIVSAHPLRGDVERSIPVLGKLTNDPDLKVRLYAVQALGTIRSEQVLPYLQKALLSPSGSVMKAANSALQNLKLYYGKTPSMQIAQQMLEKRKKA